MVFGYGFAFSFSLSLFNKSKTQEQVEDEYFLQTIQTLKLILETILLAILILIIITLIYRMKSLGDTLLNDQSKSVPHSLLEKLGLKDLKLNAYEKVMAANIITPSQLKVSWSNVAGLEGIIGKLKKSVLYPILAPQTVKQDSGLIQSPKGILLHGPPGCGKTLIAKAMAKESKCCFLNVDVSSIFEKYWGETEKSVKAIFTLAAKIQPCIIFIDEIDSLLCVRSGQNHNKNFDMVKTQFMSLWDGLETDASKTIIIMGATNRPGDIDGAILRRLPTKINVPLPNFQQRKDILHLILKDEKLGPDVDLEQLANMTETFSGSDLNDMCRSAAISCLEGDELRIEAGMVTRNNDASHVSDENSKKQLGRTHNLRQFVYRKTLRTRKGLLFLVKSMKTIFCIILRIQIVPTLEKSDDTKKEDASNGNNILMTIRPISMQDLQEEMIKIIEAKQLCSRTW